MSTQRSIFLTSNLSTLSLQLDSVTDITFFDMSTSMQSFSENIIIRYRTKKVQSLSKQQLKRSELKRLATIIIQHKCVVLLQEIFKNFS